MRRERGSRGKRRRRMMEELVAPTMPAASAILVFYGLVGSAS